MKRKLVSAPTAIIVISFLKTAMDQFFGPFLTAFFITSSMEALPQLSIYNIALYAGVALPVVLLGYLATGRNRHRAFYAGVIMDLAVSAYVLVAKENLLRHVVLFGLIRGIGTQFYWYPFNHFMITEVKDEQRQGFETARTAATKVTSILIPIVFAGIITASSYVRSSIVIVALAVVSVFFALQIGRPSEKTEYHPLCDLKKLAKDKPAFKYAFMDFHAGLYDAGLALLLPAFIVMHNSSSMNLGLVVSLASLLFVSSQFLMNKMKRRASLTWVWVSMIVVSAVSYCVFQSFAAIVVFYIVNVVCGGFLGIEKAVEQFTFLNNRPHAYALKETMLNIGRVTGLALMFIVSRKNVALAPYLLVFFTLAYIPVFIRVKKSWHH